MSRHRRGRNPKSPRPLTTVRPHSPANATVPKVALPDRPPVQAGGERPTSITCDWCRQPAPVKPRGRVPRWCSETCRHRSWEQDRAAASGRSAIRIVERTVIAAAPPPAPSAVLNWPQMLAELARQLDSGRIYDRDLTALSNALATVLDAYERHPGVRARRP